MSIPKKLVQLVLERDGYRCMIAGPNCTHEATLADHRANRGAGGAKVLDHPANLIAACAIDNSFKEDAIGPDRDELERRGVRVLHDSTHRKTLTRARNQHFIDPDGRWWFLLDNGERLEITEPAF